MVCAVRFGGVETRNYVEEICTCATPTWCRSSLQVHDHVVLMEKKSPRGVSVCFATHDGVQACIATERLSFIVAFFLQFFSLFQVATRTRSIEAASAHTTTPPSRTLDVSRRASVC